MGIMLVASQRDAVYQYLLFDVSSIGDMTTLVRNGELLLAQRLRSRFEENMRLVDQIGWEPKGKKEVYAITLASDEIRAIFRRLLGRAIEVISQPRAETVQALREAVSVADTARIVLSELPGGKQGLWL
jgi:hypothetical protein